MADPINLNVNLDTSGVERGLQGIQQQIEQLASQSNRDMARLNASLNSVSEAAGQGGAGGIGLGFAMGATAGIVMELVGQVIELGKVGVQAMAEFARGGIELNAELESSRTSLINIFNGSEEAADSFLVKMKGVAREVNQDVGTIQKIGKSILPDVGDINKTAEALKVVSIIMGDAGAQAEAVQRNLGAAIGAGDATSITQLTGILDLPTEISKKIQEAKSPIERTQAIIDEFGAFIEKQGIDPATQVQTFGGIVASIKAYATDIQQLGTIPIFDFVKEQGVEIRDFLDENFDDIIAITQGGFGFIAESASVIVGPAFDAFRSAFSELVAFLKENEDAIYNNFEAFKQLAEIVVLRLVPSVGSLIKQVAFLSPLLQNLYGIFSGDELNNTSTDMMDLFDNLTDIADQVSIIIDLWGGLTTVFQRDSTTSVADISDAVGLVSGALETLIKLVGMSNATINAFVVAGKSVVTALGESFQKLAEGDVQGSIDALRASHDALGTDVLEAYSQEILKTQKLLDDLESRRDQRAKDRLDRGGAPEPEEEVDLEAGQQAGEAELAKKALVSLNEEIEALEKERTRISEEGAEKREKIEASHQKTKREFAIKGQNELISEEIKNSRSREKIARDSARRIEDIERKHAQAVADATEDGDDAIRDASQNFSREQSGIARNAAIKRADIERNLQKELRDIQMQFQQSALEAERNNDAQAFAEAARSSNQQVEQAQLGAQDQEEQLAQETALEQQELARRREIELQNIEEQNREKLEKLQERLEQELESEKLKTERALEEQSIKEQEGAEDRVRKRAEEEAKIERMLQDRLAAVQTEANKELQIVAETEAAKRAEIEKTQQKIAQASAQQRQSSSVQRTSDSVSGGRGRSPGGRRDYNDTVKRTAKSVEGGRGRAIPRRQFGGPVQDVAQVLESGPEIFRTQGKDFLMTNSPGNVIPLPVMPSTTNNVTNKTNRIDSLTVDAGMMKSPEYIEFIKQTVLAVMAEV